MSIHIFKVFRFLLDQQNYFAFSNFPVETLCQTFSELKLHLSQDIKENISEIKTHNQFSFEKKLKTMRSLSTRIFSATLVLQKKYIESEVRKPDTLLK